jgi:hypothetical protein
MSSDVMSCHVKHCFTTTRLIASLSSPHLLRISIVISGMLTGLTFTLDAISFGTHSFSLSSKRNGIKRVIETNQHAKNYDGNKRKVQEKLPE